MNFKEYQDKAKSTAIYPNQAKLIKSIAKAVIKKSEKPDAEMNARIEGALQQMSDLPQFRNINYPALGLAGEVGEFCNKLKKVMRDKGGVVTPEFLEFARGEIGDILWYVSACCSELDLDMNEIAEANIAKLFSRKERNVLIGNGDNR